MRNRTTQPSFAIRILLCAAIVLVAAGPAGATQVHPPAEGPIVHQMGHLFFAFAMGILIYWLRERKLIREVGWRFVQYSALFFILWNLDTMVVHYLDGRQDLFETINAGPWEGWIQLVEGSRGLAILYYIGKMDHLLCLPAMIFLTAGLYHLLRQERASSPETPR